MFDLAARSEQRAVSPTPSGSSEQVAVDHRPFGFSRVTVFCRSRFCKAERAPMPASPLAIRRHPGCRLMVPVAAQVASIRTSRRTVPQPARSAFWSAVSATTVVASRSSARTRFIVSQAGNVIILYGRRPLPLPGSFFVNNGVARFCRCRGSAHLNYASARKHRR